ncbi:MAG: 4-(cytidine 5'-diphospho)-2-C-methyl-D-erythritol kinase, partial [Patescibacteria group bacterium]
MKKIRLKSPAKINLTLEVIKKLPSGFHELRSVMLKLSNLYDELEIAFDDKGIGVEIVCENKNVPTDKRNIVFKIAEKFFERTGKRAGLKIKIKKRIPVSAGLGGGSSNGASVLMALNDYFGKPLSLKGLIKVAAEVGKDIPVFLVKERLVYVSGMGEKLKNIRKKFQWHILIVSPGGEISTPWAYGELDKRLVFMKDKRRFNFTEKFIKSLPKLEICRTYNDFEIVANEKYPEVEVLKKSLLSFGAVDVSLTGK